jgi:hypothetical protein
MRVRRSFRRFIILPVSMTAVAVSASTALAQGRPLFDWSGRVDREVRISMRGRDARAHSVGRYDAQRSRLDIATPLPEREGRVFVRVEDGRGDVDVVQQPSARNNYTTIVRIRDRSSGTDVYRVSAYWAPDGTGNGGWDGRDNYPPRPGRGDDDRYGRDRDRDGRDDRGGWGRDNDRNGSEVLRWSGDVDDALEIRIQGNRVDYRTLSGKSVRNVRANLVRGGLPRDDVYVMVTDRAGRGSVSVVQQPNARNNYTAVIRVYDPRSGYGDYQFDVSYRRDYSNRR